MKKNRATKWSSKDQKSFKLIPLKVQGVTDCKMILRQQDSYSLTYFAPSKSYISGLVSLGGTSEDSLLVY